MRARVESRDAVAGAMQQFCDDACERGSCRSIAFRLIVVVDDSQFVAESLSNFLWVTFHALEPGRRHLRH